MLRIHARCGSHKSHGAVQRLAIAIVYAHFFARSRANVPSVTRGVSPLTHRSRRARVPGPAKLRADGVFEVARSLLYPTRRRESR